MTTIATFKSWGRYKSRDDAEECAINHQCAYGFCVCDGFFYVGEHRELLKGPMVDIRDPYDFPEERCFE